MIGSLIITKKQKYSEGPSQTNIHKTNNMSDQKNKAGNAKKVNDDEKGQPSQAATDTTSVQTELNRLLQNPQAISQDAMFAMQLSAPARQQQPSTGFLQSLRGSPPQQPRPQQSIIPQAPLLAGAGQQSISTADLQQLLAAQAVLDRQREQQQQALIASLASRQQALQQSPLSSLNNSDMALIRALQQGQQQQHHPFTGLASAEETSRLIQQSRAAEQLHLAQQQQQQSSAAEANNLDTQRLLLNLLSTATSSSSPSLSERSDARISSDSLAQITDRLRGVQQHQQQQQASLSGGIGGQANTSRTTLPSIQHILSSNSGTMGAGNAAGLGVGNFALSSSLTAQQQALLGQDTSTTIGARSNTIGNAAEQLLTGGISTGTLSSLEQLLGRSAAARLPNNPSSLLTAGGGTTSAILTAAGAVPFPFSSNPVPAAAASMSQEAATGKDDMNSDPLQRQRKKRAYRHVSFPEKLHNLLCDVENEGKNHIVSWINGGTALQIHNSNEFEKEILPKYFRHGKVSSFHRQLLLYGFTRIKEGRGRGGFQHELFRRDLPHRLKDIQRIDY